MVAKGRRIRCHTRAQENYLLKRWTAIGKKIGAIGVEKQDIFLALVLSDNNARKLHKWGIQTEEMGTVLEAT